MKDLNDYISRYEAEKIRDDFFIEMDNRQRNLEFSPSVDQLKAFIEKRNKYNQKIKDQYEEVMNKIALKIKKF